MLGASEGKGKLLAVPLISIKTSFTVTAHVSPFDFRDFRRKYIWLHDRSNSAAGPPYLSSTSPAPAASIHFKRVQLDDKFRSEGCCVGDFNHDGKLDIAAGSVYYTAPDWKMHQFREQADEFDPLHYSESFMNYSADLNGDGWTDLIVVGFPGKDTSWYENPRAPMDRGNDI